MTRPRKQFGALAAGAIVHGSTIDTGFGTTADCSTAAGYLLNPACWGYSPEAWREMAAFGAQASTMPTPTPPAAVPLATTGQATYAGPADEVVQQFARETTDVLQAAADTSRAQIQSWAGDQAPIEEAPTWWSKYGPWLIGAGAAVAAVALSQQK